MITVLAVTRACGNTYDTNNTCFLRPFYEPGTVASAWHILSHFILTTTQRVRYHQPHFVDTKVRVREMKSFAREHIVNEKRS